MKFTQKLLAYLHKVFDKDPHEFLAIRLQYRGGLTWTISDGFLYTTVTGGPGQNLTVDLSKYTVSQLVGYLSTQTGYSVLYSDTSNLSKLQALVLMEASGDISQSNGDHLYGYTNVLWSYMDSQSNELEQAQTQIGEMLNQMSTTTAADEWLDLLGAYYGVPRLTGEDDTSYGPRIIAEVLRPRGNNVAIEMAIQAYTGQISTVTDVTLYGPTAPLYNSTITRNSAYRYNAVSKPLYGLFDVQYGYDLINGGDVSAFTQTVKDLVNKLRDAGTQMRSLSLTGSALLDALTPPTDATTFGVGAAFTDTLTAPTDAFAGATTLAGFADTLTAPTDNNASVARYGYAHNGVRQRNSLITRAGGTVEITPAAAIDWNFRTGALDPSLTFTRASAGTYFNSSGIMQTAAVNAPRFDCDPSTGLALGLLLEESRTNQFLYSQAFQSNSYWNIKAQCAVADNAGISPDGTNNASLVTLGSSVSNSYLGYGASTGSFANQTLTFSIFLKLGTFTGVIAMYLRDSSDTNYGSGGFTLSGAGSASGSYGSRTIQNVGNGWYRCSVTGTFAAGAAAGIHCYIDPSDSSVNVNQTYQVYGAQLESGAFLTSYIATNGATATRAADVLTSSSIPWFSASAGTLCLDYADANIYSPTANEYLFAISDGTLNNRLSAFKQTGSSGRAFRYVNGGVTQFSNAETAAYATGGHRIAVTYPLAAATARDGAAGPSGSGLTAISGLTTLSLGCSEDTTTNYLNGWIRRFTYVASALDSTLLPLLTT
jgi:hypothetical protein